MQAIFSTNVGMHDLRVSFCEANSTWRNDISSKNLLNRPICIEINKSALSRVFNLMVTMKPISPYMTKALRFQYEFGDLPIFFGFLSWVGHYLTAAKVLKKSERGKILGANVLELVELNLHLQKLLPNCRQQNCETSTACHGTSRIFHFLRAPPASISFCYLRAEPNL